MILFLVYSVLDDTSIEQVVKDLIEIDALDAIGYDHVDDVIIVKLLLE